MLLGMNLKLQKNPMVFTVRDLLDMVDHILNQNLKVETSQILQEDITLD